MSRALFVRLRSLSSFSKKNSREFSGVLGALPLGEGVAENAVVELVETMAFGVRGRSPFGSIFNGSSIVGWSCPKSNECRAQEPLVEMTATLNVVVSINSTTVLQTYWTSTFVQYFSVRCL